MAKQNTARKTAPDAGVPRPIVQPTGKALPDLDRLIHERMRLGIISALAVNESVTFNELKKLLKTTDGNLSVHARKLEEAGYVAVEKRFANRKPQTLYALTSHGRRALLDYVAHLESLLPSSTMTKGRAR